MRSSLLYAVACQWVGGSAKPLPRFSKQIWKRARMYPSMRRQRNWTYKVDACYRLFVIDYVAFLDVASFHENPLSRLGILVFYFWHSSSNSTKTQHCILQHASCVEEHRNATALIEMRKWGRCFATSHSKLLPAYKLCHPVIVGMAVTNNIIAWVLHPSRETSITKAQL